MNRSFTVVLLSFSIALRGTGVCQGSERTLSKEIKTPDSPILSGILSTLTWREKQFRLVFPVGDFAGSPKNTGCLALPEEHKALITQAFNEVATFSQLSLSTTESAQTLTFCAWDRSYTRLGRVNAILGEVNPMFPWICEGIVCQSIPGHTWLNSRNAGMTDATPGSYMTWWWRHEIGHMLGLEHPHNNITRKPLDRKLDRVDLTLMSYRMGETFLDNFPRTNIYPTSYMPLDIWALQYLYGVNTAFNAEDTYYQWKSGSGSYWRDGIEINGNPSGTVLMTLWDGGGTDTIDFSDYDLGLTIDSRPGHFVVLPESQTSDFGPGGDAKGSIAFPFLLREDRSGLIENLVGGGGSDKIIANEANNNILGGDGTDRFVFFPGTHHDQVMDYSQGEVIDLCGYGVASKLVSMQAIGENAIEITVTQFPIDRIIVRGDLYTPNDVRIETSCVD